MKLKQLSIEIENSPGRLYGITKILGEAGINLKALSLADTTSFGQLRILVSNLPEARRLLMKLQVPAKVDEVVAAEITDQPGALAKLLKALLQTRISVQYMYAFTGGESNKAIMIFHFCDVDRAVQVLLDHGISLLSAKDFGIVESN
ncbi:MAG: amino acid-binding protein [SAR324 cluster bacterium]|uniref:Amino acid-binding protein n=1 Tax=SAR324 cluster bacterium TaxID=2024889 RepID=A0A2A4SS83_9DELT|nr:MAG: amino acid-binding protein [SAR324 cluster bacterium]